MDREYRELQRAFSAGEIDEDFYKCLILKYIPKNKIKSATKKIRKLAHLIKQQMRPAMEGYYQYCYKPMPWDDRDSAKNKEEDLKPGEYLKRFEETINKAVKEIELDLLIGKSFDPDKIKKTFKALKLTAGEEDYGQLEDLINQPSRRYLYYYSDQRFANIYNRLREILKNNPI